MPKYYKKREVRWEYGRGVWKAHKVDFIWITPNRKNKNNFFNEVNRNLDQTRYIDILMEISILTWNIEKIDISIFKWKKIDIVSNSNCWYHPSLELSLLFTSLLRFRDTFSYCVERCFTNGKECSSLAMIFFLNYVSRAIRNMWAPIHAYKKMFYYGI